MKSFTIFDPLPRGTKRDPYKHLRCTHHHHNLRGCWLPRGHSGPHDNPNLRQFQKDFTTWEDADGSYINTPDDWRALIDALIDRGRRGEFGGREDLEKEIDHTRAVQDYLKQN